MNSENTTNPTTVTSSTLSVYDLIPILLPLAVPVISNAIDKIYDIAHNAMEHDYNLTIKTRTLNISLVKDNANTVKS